MVGERVARVLIDQGGEFNHGYTYSRPPGGLRGGAGQHPADPRAEGLVERVRDDTGPYLAQRFARAGDHPLVGEAQTCGLMGALQLVQRQGDAATLRSSRRASRHGLPRPLLRATALIMRAVGDRMIVAPPLVITRAQIDEMVGADRAVPRPDPGRRCARQGWSEARRASALHVPMTALRRRCRDMRRPFAIVHAYLRPSDEDVP